MSSPNGINRDILFDFDRNARIGLPESVFCQGKPVEALVALMRKFARGSGHPILFTRLAPDIFRSLPQDVQDGVDYHASSRTAWGDTLPRRAGVGRVAVVSAGTSDGGVAWEAGRTLTYLGIEHSMFEDCGVAGLWRLTERLSEINRHDVVIAVAGMDAALASVLGGLTAKPLLAVPTSVGYGVVNRGESALNSMLASCAPGVSVFNVDNGYGAACAAARIVGLICR
ncbi:MAG: nickel pincer cofactor biosynthesis protein LarB [Pseudorhodoplanes sp.]|nr:Pyridinium-3,5-biscarboxylic acid mononucleotide synthase [Pseudorhodoplanes sp.]MBW7947865.1 nickel pincer cofactor biosynthesis protein LarB [Pseudorhodoplanes sp.]MCL4709648.1 nickel pincer cofactor biosynthesis protein LarB [Pseudorhodoplanes sp.]MCZ7643318.1 nickel pincer cofactor biosynthesis protein LarB [Pseudorhodoplanes sp.]GIK79739.1 MAG: 1-(5-phosphoribosyl)-5-amino-4-imidazole-carboxyl ate carboxylase [Alphaproteobacteria bacterium]